MERKIKKRMAELSWKSYSKGVTEDEVNEFRLLEVKLRKLKSRKAL